MLFEEVKHFFIRSMSFLPLHRDKEHKFKNGHWTWGENEAKLKFHSHDDDKQTKQKLCGLLDAGLKFAEYINVAEEKILREVFLRSEKFYDSEVVTLQDIKILAFFTMKSKATRKLIEFLHTQTFDKFLHGTIFYIDMYLLILEYLLIRRDKEEKGKIRDMYSIQIEQQLSKQLSDRRLLIAREYSKVLDLIISSLKLSQPSFISDFADARQKRIAINVSIETHIGKGFTFLRIDD